MKQHHKAHTAVQQHHAPAADAPASAGTIMFQIVAIPAFAALLVWFWIKRAKARMGYRTVTVRRERL